MQKQDFSDLPSPVTPPGIPVSIPGFFPLVCGAFSFFLFFCFLFFVLFWFFLGGSFSVAIGRVSDGVYLIMLLLLRKPE